MIVLHEPVGISSIWFLSIKLVVIKYLEFAFLIFFKALKISLKKMDQTISVNIRSNLGYHLLKINYLEIHVRSLEFFAFSFINSDTFAPI